MLFQRINRTDAEKVFIVLRNDGANAWAKGGPIVLKADGTRDGIDAVKPSDGAIANTSLLIGVADAATAAGDYGLVQCYGLRTDTKVRQCGTATNGNGAMGDGMIISSAGDMFSAASSGAVLSAVQYGVVLMSTVASSAATSDATAAVERTCFLRLM